MSKCAACLEGLCRRHPLQDHGERAAKLTALAAEAAGKQRSDLDMIHEQIERLQNAARGTSVDDQAEYKLQMEKERRIAEKRKRKNLSSEYLELAGNSGLHASVLSAMMAESEDSDGDSDSSSASEGDKKKHKSKKRKKEKKSSKKSTKSSKSEKKKKSRKRSRSSER